MHAVQANTFVVVHAVQANTFVSALHAVSVGTRASPVHRGVIFLEKKGRKQNVQTGELVVTGRTPATNLKL